MRRAGGGSCTLSVMTSDYQPVGCDQHSMLELLAMRQTRVSVQSEDERGGVTRVKGKVTDIVTRDGAEYLVVRDEAENLVSLRLDRIRTIEQAGGETIWRQ